MTCFSIKETEVHQLFRDVVLLEDRVTVYVHANKVYLSDLHFLTEIRF